MFRFAFIMNVPGQSPETYSKVYENEKSYNLLAGTGDMDMAEALICQLADQDFTVVNLCGDFGDGEVMRFMVATENKIKIKRVDYYPEELARVEAMESLSEYGIIIKDDGVTEIVNEELLCRECNTYVKFAKDLEDAKKAAVELVERGVYFIELCSWFDKEKMDAITDAILHKVPVGTCGDIK